MLHAKLAPSSAARRAICPGSRSLEENYPELTVSESSREGTAAHWVAQQYLMDNYGHFAHTPDGQVVTEEMRDGADLYENEIKYRAEGNELHIEERVDISNIHPDCWGTPDCWFLVGDHLHIFDYKFGHGYVEVVENWQLLEYAAGVALKVDCAKVTMTIIQPRCYTREGPKRSWTISSFDLFNEYIPRARSFEHAATSTLAVSVPSSECLHCRARHACTALQTTAGKFMDVSTDSYELDSRQTAWELKHLKHAMDMIEARMTGLEEQAKSMIVRGEYVPGFKLEYGQGREHWKMPSEEIILLGEMMELNLSKPREVITPAQARKAGIPDDLINTYSQRISGKLKLVEDNNAAKVFKK